MLYDELAILSQCACCQQDIQVYGIECAECTLSNINIATGTPNPRPQKLRLCLECFQLGAEVGPHKADHKYKFFDAAGKLVVFQNENKSSQFTADENLRLLDAIEQYGFGNWHDISKHVESKSANECKEEYVRRFVKGSIGKNTWAEPLQKYSKSVHVERPRDHTTPDEGPLSPSLSQRLQPLDIADDEVTQLGYMPNRDDYEKEFDNDAEKLVCNLAFGPDDDDLDVSLKLSLVDMYTRRLRERTRRKHVIRDYQLVSQFFKKERGTLREGNRARRRFYEYEKEISEKLKPFAQFHTAKEHEHFIYNLVREKELVFRLQELYRYRSNGITNQEDCLEYEKLKGRKKANVPNLSAVDEAEAQGGSLKKGLKTATTTLTQGQTDLPNYLMSQSKTQSGNVESDENSISHTKNLTAPPSSCVGTNSSSGESKFGELLLPAIEQQQKEKQGPLTVAQGAENPNYLQPQEEQRVSVDQFIANMENLSSFDLLSEKEQDFCIRLRLTPNDYVQMKFAYIMDTKPSTLDKKTWNQFTSFMRSCGWNPEILNQASLQL